MPIVCSKCGEVNADDTKMCGMCGILLQQPVSTPQNAPTMAPTASRTTSPAGGVGAVPSPSGQTMAPQRRVPIRHAPFRPEYAGFGLRLVAALIDGVLLCIVLVPFFLLYAMAVITTALFTAAFHRGHLTYTIIAVVSLTPLVIQWLYKVIMESSPLQATVGKLAVKIKVVDLEGNRISFGQASVRFFAMYSAPAIAQFIVLAAKPAFLIGLADLYVLFCGLRVARDPMQQGLHDTAAGTLVVKK